MYTFKPKNVVSFFPDPHRALHLDPIWSPKILKLYYV